MTIDSTQAKCIMVMHQISTKDMCTTYVTKHYIFEEISGSKKSPDYYRVPRFTVHFWLPP